MKSKMSVITFFFFFVLRFRGFEVFGFCPVSSSFLGGSSSDFSSVECCPVLQSQSKKADFHRDSYRHSQS